MATINPPWRLDPLQMIVNINYGAKYLLWLQFNWNDLVLNHFVLTISQPPTVTTASVGITDDAPSGMLIYDNTIVVSSDQGSGVLANSYRRTMVFDIGVLPSVSDPFTITFSVSDQDDFVDYEWGTHTAESSLGLTDLFNSIDAPQTTFPRTGPWVGMATNLYSESLYFVDESSPLNVMKPKDTHNNPGPVAGMHLGQNVQTVPSTDERYYAGPFAPGQSVISGGSYATIGVLRGGTLALSMANFPLFGISPTRTVPLLWPTEPIMFDLSYVFGHPLTLGIDPYLVPNPPPLFSCGVYTVSPDPSAGGSPNTGAYQSGGPPIPSNAYTGSYPTP